MLLEKTDWNSVVKQISSATSLSITDICYEVGLGRAANPPSEPRHSEGEALLKLF